MLLEDEPCRPVSQKIIGAGMVMRRSRSNGEEIGVTDQHRVLRSLFSGKYRTLRAMLKSPVGMVEGSAAARPLAGEVVLLIGLVNICSCFVADIERSTLFNGGGLMSGRFGL